MKIARGGDDVDATRRPKTSSFDRKALSAYLADFVPVAFPREQHPSLPVANEIGLRLNLIRRRHANAG